MCVGALVMSIYIDPQLSLVFVVLIPIFVLVLVVIMKKTVPLYQNAQRKLDRLGQVLRENLSGVRVIRALPAMKKNGNGWTKQPNSWLGRISMLPIFPL